MAQSIGHSSYLAVGGEWISLRDNKLLQSYGLVVVVRQLHQVVDVGSDKCQCLGVIDFAAAICLYDALEFMFSLHTLGSRG